MRKIFLTISVVAITFGILLALGGFLSGSDAQAQTPTTTPSPTPWHTPVPGIPDLDDLLTKDNLQLSMYGSVGYEPLGVFITQGSNTSSASFEAVSINGDIIYFRIAGDQDPNLVQGTWWTSKNSGAWSMQARSSSISDGYELWGTFQAKTLSDSDESSIIKLHAQHTPDRPFTLF